MDSKHDMALSKKINLIGLCENKRNSLFFNDQTLLASHARKLSIKYRMSINHPLGSILSNSDLTFSFANIKQPSFN